MSTANSLFQPDAIFMSGMVLQREKPIHVWGTAPAGSVVSVTLGHQGGFAPVRSDNTFSVQIPPMEAAEDLLLTITCTAEDTAPYEFYPVHVGDVWLAGGQSNMELFLKYDRDFDDVETSEKNPHIHMYNVPQQAFFGHTSHNKGGYGYWFGDGEEGYERFSAAAYSFARHLQPVLNVPIGLIGCNWGGTSAMAWVKEDVLQTPELEFYLKEYEAEIEGKDPIELKKESLRAWVHEDSQKHGKEFEPMLFGKGFLWQKAYQENHSEDPVIPMGPYHMYRPCGLYYTMLSKLFPFSLKGALWYQGESDSGDRAKTYDKLLSGLIQNWRNSWNDEFPFLLVQLAPYGWWLGCDNAEYTTVRAMQEKVCKELADVYFASIMDLGSRFDIHPKEKQEVGRRLALLARGHVYGEENLLCDSPIFETAAFPQKNKLVLTFANAEGLTVTHEGSDLRIRAGALSLNPISVTAENNALVITLPETGLPGGTELEVSLGWDNYSEIYIHNASGLCVAPFKTTVKL